MATEKNDVDARPIRLLGIFAFVIMPLILVMGAIASFNLHTTFGR